MIKILDNYLPEPDLEAQEAEWANYQDLVFNGTTYPQIAICNNDEARVNEISEIVGKKLTASLPPFYRKYLPTDAQPTYIHSDVGEGDYTVIIFLNKINENNGLAFWEHANGEEKANKLSVGRYALDGLDETKWLTPKVVPAQYNRAVVFSSALFHSRWPRNNWLIGQDTARVIKVMFLKEVV